MENKIFNILMTWKIKYLKYKNKYLLLKNQIGGVLCPNYGFTQHSGECWHDSFSTIICFSDIIQSIVLQEYFNLDDFIDCKKTNFLLPINYNLFDIEEFNIYSKEYLLNLIERLKNKLKDNSLSLLDFIDKKPSEIDKQNLEGDIPDNVRPSIVKSSSFKNSLACVSSSYNRYNFNIIERFDKKQGGLYLHELINLQLINYYFSQNNTFINIKKFNIKNILQLTPEFISNVTGISLHLADEIDPIHQTAFYECGGQLFYYDTNGLEDGNVIIKFNWKSIMISLIKDSTFIEKLEVEIRNHTTFSRNITTFVCYYIDTFDNEQDYYYKLFKNYNYFCTYKNERLRLLTENPIILELAKENFGYVYCNLTYNKIITDEEWLDLVKINGMSLKYAPIEIKSNKEISSVAIKENNRAYDFINELSLDKKIDIIIDVSKNNIRFLYKIPKNIYNNQRISDFMDSYDYGDKNVISIIKLHRIYS